MGTNPLGLDSTHEIELLELLNDKYLDADGPIVGDKIFSDLKTLSLRARRSSAGTVET